VPLRQLSADRRGGAARRRCAPRSLFRVLIARAMIAGR
jgi:hypothetical protein